MLSYGLLIGLLHHVVTALLYPVIIALGLCLLLSLWELGSAIAERFFSLKHFTTQPLAVFEQYAKKRLERSDILSKSGPILGLMGTSVPLGPGLSALNSGNLDILSTAITVAFDTTVIGLLAGLITFVISRMRRRWYNDIWHAIEQKENHHEP